MPRVQVTEVNEVTEEHTEATEASNGQNQEASREEMAPALPTSRFQIRPEHFALAIDEQRERYAVQEEAEEVIAQREEGRQRLLEMASNYNADGKPPLRGFRLWLARLFGLAS